jgi:hypothetical protein
MSENGLIRYYCSNGHLAISRRENCVICGAPTPGAMSAYIANKRMVRAKEEKEIIASLEVTVPPKKKRKQKPKYTNEELLETLREFERREGREPEVNDFTSKSPLPAHTTYYAHFGSFVRARDIAFGREKNM